MATLNEEHDTAVKELYKLLLAQDPTGIQNVYAGADRTLVVQLRPGASHKDLPTTFRHFPVLVEASVSSKAQSTYDRHTKAANDLWALLKKKGVPGVSVKTFLDEGDEPVLKVTADQLWDIPNQFRRYRVDAVESQRPAPQERRGRPSRPAKPPAPVYRPTPEEQHVAATKALSKLLVDRGVSGAVGGLTVQGFRILRILTNTPEHPGIPRHTYQGFRVEVCPDPSYWTSLESLERDTSRLVDKYRRTQSREVLEAIGRQYVAWLDRRSV